MTFWEHLDELRKVLFRSVILFIILLAVIFLNKSFVFEKIIFAPASSDFILFRLLKNFSEPFSLELINIELSSQFFTHISVSATLAFILSVPFILHQLWTFIKPGLYEKERRAVNVSFGFAAILFFAGVLVGYYFVFPLTVRFLGTYQVSELVENQISLKSYISMFTRLILIMGLVFEMPALVLILSRIGVLSKRVMKKYRKHAFVALVIIAAVITPSGDAFTLFIVSAPLYLLYEFSVLICRDLDKQS
ncbi:MAG: twin-arginine translocase subunit TatC [Bacteroidales bacterium]|nr:twin-arginine translocase subunit TatC [Bacteroidales bacterium]MDD3988496.1 twin-arginine translocase subunit TatC [Bacteroidales bacterium]MDD4639135.1 twin-arginine translocase subunit TatC [Bacteroidales bacterium]